MPPPLYWRHESSLEHDTGAHPENARRIPAIERELAARDWLGWERREAPAAEVERLLAVHPERHVESVRRTSEAGGGWFDADTVASAGTWEAALRASGAACAMVEELLARRAPAGFCGLRPPGHHAETATAMGFCFLNNVAIAARHALDALGAERVVVLDWDVHHGNGTNEVFHGSREVLFCSIHQSPLYPGTGPLEDVGSGEGEGYSMNLPVPPGSGEDEWLGLVEHVLAPAARAFEPDLLLVSAGFDGHREDPLANCRLEDASFRDLARSMRALGDELGAPVGCVLEGGYDLGALSRSVAATLEGLCDGGQARSVEPGPVVERARAAHARYWPV
jgi:acetoin utilization deacetylase AcuC-like enzyme